MKRHVIFGVALGLLVAGGCKPKGKDIPTLTRKEAATLVGDADFAVTLRDLAKAEGLYAKAVELCPDTGEYWLSLGTTRARLKQRDGAKKAYQGALAAFEAVAKDPKNAKDSGPALQQVYVLALLGRVDDARALVEKTKKAFPGDINVRKFVEGRQLDAMLASPMFKEVGL